MPRMLLHAFNDPHNYNSRNPMEKTPPMPKIFLPTEIIWNVIIAFLGFQNQSTSKEIKREIRSTQAIVTGK